MNAFEKTTPRRRKGILVLLLIFVVMAGVVTVVFLFPTDDTLEAELQTRVPSEPPILTLIIPEKAKPFAESGEGSKFRTLREEIDFLNLKNSIPFQESFRSGKASDTTLANYLTPIANGFVINVNSSSFLTTPTYHDSCLYVSGGFSSKTFYAFDAFNGQLKWAVVLDDDGPSSSVVADSIILFNTESCTVFALNIYTGKMIWSKWLGDPLMTNPVTDGKFLYTTYPSLDLYDEPTKTKAFKSLTPSHALAALEVTTGKIAWQRWLDGDIMTTPVLDDEHLYITTFSGTIYKIGRQNGKILAATNLAATSIPTILGDKIFVTKRADLAAKPYESIAVLDKHTLKVIKEFNTQPAPYLDYAVQSKSKWKTTCAEMDFQNGFYVMPEHTGWKKARKIIGQSNVSALQNHLGSTLTAGDNKLYNCSGDKISCFDAQTCQLLWTLPIVGDLAVEGGHLATAPLLVANYVVSVTFDGQVLLINKNDGTIEKRYAVNQPVRNQPIAVAGILYVPTTNGELVCINTGDPSIDGWKMFMKNNQHHTGVGLQV